MEPWRGIGVYGVPEAARLARVPLRTASRWVAGEGSSRAGRLLRPDYPMVEHRHALSFLDLIDLLVVGRFREAGVHFRTIRRVYEHLRGTLGVPHAFAHNRLFTDGENVFREVADAIDSAGLEEVLTGQRAMPVILSPYLEELDFGRESGVAERWRVAEGVVIDPARSFGKPVLASASTTTYALARAFEANRRDAELVADLFDVTPSDVRHAVEFERSIAPNRAA